MNELCVPKNSLVWEVHSRALRQCKISHHHSNYSFLRGLSSIFISYLSFKGCNTEEILSQAPENKPTRLKTFQSIYTPTVTED